MIRAKILYSHQSCYVQVKMNEIEKMRKGMNINN